MINNFMMGKECEGLDPGFKLFGTNIPVCSYQVEDNKKPSAATSKSFVESEFNKDNASVEDKEKVESNQKDDDNEGQDGEKAALKKPDKLLPCPRCESMDTKFCYYNNYNVNQPRHFCKNCQRYWTAGGSLRNVPVGAGRRKNKHAISSPHYRQIRSSSASVSAAAAAALGLRTHDHESAMKMIPSPLKMQIEVADSGATVLNFGQESCGKTIPGGGDSERMEQSRDEISCSSSVTGEREAADHMNPQADGLKWPNGAVAGASPAPFFTGPWSYGWNVNVGARGTWGAMSWPLLPASPFGGWATVPWLPAPWAVAGATVSPNNNSDSGSPILGKRPQSEGPKTAEGGLPIPKTLRVEDPREAARSSVRTTLGLGNKAESTAFKAFQPKTEAEGRYDAASEVLRANPAAFSRSISFQESN